MARISPLSLVRMIWKEKLWVILVWMVVTAIGVAMVMRIKPTYRAETLIMVETQKIPDKYVASTVVTDVQDRLATISQEILSVSLLKTIIDDYKLYPEQRAAGSFEEVVERMRRDVGVKLERGWSGNRPGAFRISYQGSDPVVVAAVANRLAGLYMDQNLKERENQAEGTAQFLDSQLKEAKKTLDDLEAAVSRYKIQHNGELPQQENAIHTALVRLQTELQGTQDAVSRAQQNRLLIDAELATIEGSLSAATAPREDSRENAAASRVVDRRGAPVATRSQILEQQLTALRARYSEEHPDVRRAKAALAEALNDEKQRSASAPSAGDSAPTPASAPKPERIPPEASREADRLINRASALRAQRVIAEQEIENSALERKRILKEMGVYQAQLKSLPIREQEMAALTRDYEISKANYRSLLDKKTSADMATEMEHRQKAERFTPIDSAVPPERPAKPNRPVLAGVAAVIGLILGLAFALGREWNKDVLLGEWELPSGVYILGRIPKIDIPPDGERRSAKRKRTRSRAEAVATTGVLIAVMWVVGGAAPGCL